MNDTWKEICFELGTCIHNNALEKEYENAVVNCMVLLGWKKFRGEIVTQYPVQAGHESKYADIVILEDGKEQFVIEIKRPNHKMQEDDEKQLFSYMRLLKRRVAFGLYIGDRIRLYYDKTESQQFPEKVFTLDIREDNLDGIKFVELFSKETFDPHVLHDFCASQSEAIKERSKIRDEAGKILSDCSGSIFKELLKRKYTEEGHSEDWAESVLAQIRLSVSPASDERVRNLAPVLNTDITYRKNIKAHDKTRYGILGSDPLPKRKFVLEVVRNFVAKNPPMTYEEYSNILNKLRPDSQGVIRPMESLSGKRMIRYFTEDKYRMTSSDGITFVVCNQWGDFNIGPVIRFAEEQGLDVTEYRPE